ncbi:MAG: epoxyqueuosine reductase [Nitrospinae bacterium]|nr:epoxyqueuosine reductase [Nitrospinota bacterium]
MNLTPDLKNYCKNSRADMVGIADLESFRNRLPVIPQNLLTPYAYAISVGIRLKDDIVNRISDHPTPEYSDHYQSINKSLDSLTAQIAQWIIQKGSNAMPIPASHTIDEANLLGNISHKAVARMAGLGWQGKSLLIINPELGPRFRLATVLTDMMLTADQPVKNKCGKCRECVDACPASAIKNVSTDSHYENRDIAINLERCNSKLIEFEAMPGIGHRICGVCIKVCPYGK